jgi:excisionase family DNA binding protein
MDPVYLSFSETAARLEISKSAIYRLIREGSLTAYYRKARPASPLFREDQVEALGEVQPRPQEQERASA